MFDPSTLVWKSVLNILPSLHKDIKAIDEVVTQNTLRKINTPSSIFDLLYLEGRAILDLLGENEND
jgi:hypothetical protein